MGSQQNKSEDQSSSQKQQQKRYQHLWKQHCKQPKTSYDFSLHNRVVWESKEGIRGGKTTRSLQVTPMDKHPIFMMCTQTHLE